MKKCTILTLLVLIFCTATAASAEQVGRESRAGNTLTGEAEWNWESRNDYLSASRKDMGDDADFYMILLDDEEMIEEATGMTYEDDIKLPRSMRECIGAEVATPGSYYSAFLIVCPDGDYLNLVVGTNEDDVIDVAEQMNDGKKPVPPVAYKSVD